MIFLSDCFWHLKRKMHKDFKKILGSGITENKAIFTYRKCPSVEFPSFFFWRFLSTLLLDWNIKKKGSLWKKEKSRGHRVSYKLSKRWKLVPATLTCIIYNVQPYIQVCPCDRTFNPRLSSFSSEFKNIQGI